MITAEEIIAELVEQMGEAIGSYTFAEGQVTPAIRIDDGSEPYEEEPAVTGLEVVIVPSPEVNITPLMGGYQEDYTTLIQLRQWDINDTTMPYLDAVLQAIGQFQTLNLVRTQRVMRSNKLDNIETLTISVSESVLTPAGEL